MATIGRTPCGAVVAEDVRNLQRWTSHGRQPLFRLRLPAPCLGLSALPGQSSIGLLTAAMMPVATRV